VLENIETYFDEFPARWKVAKLLFQRGFQVRDDGKIVSGNIEIPHSQIAKEVDVGRRAVDETAETILSVPQLKRIYANLRQTYSLEEIARQENLGVIVIVPEDPHEKGILFRVAKEVYEHNLEILQVFAEHPSMSTEPKLTIILEKKCPPTLIERLQKLEGIRHIILC